jgi:hypothetical protein
MHGDDLKQAWTALQAQRRARQPDGEWSQSDPSPEALEAALNGTLPNDERERVLNDVLSQGRGEELRLLHTMRRAAEQSVSASRANTGRSWQRWWPAAAAATLVVAIGIPTWQSQRGSTAGTSDSATYRGGTTVDVQLVAPASGLSWPSVGTDSLRVVWRTVGNAVGYTVELLDANGHVVMSQSVTGDTTALIAAPTDGPDTAPAGWWVYASLSDGRRVRSELRLLQPNRP